VSRADVPRMKFSVLRFRANITVLIATSSSSLRNYFSLAVHTLPTF